MTRPTPVREHPAAPPLVDSIDELDAGWFTTALRRSGVLTVDAAVTRAQTSLFGTGQFGLVVQAHLEYVGTAPNAPESVIVKLPSDDAACRRLAITIGAYEAESCFYEDIGPRVKVAAPQLYWGDVDTDAGRSTLVLEDLSATWMVGDAVAGGTVEQAEAAVEQLVALQAPLWNDSSLRDYAWLAAPARTQALFDIVAPALPAFRERFADRLGTGHMKLVEQLAPVAHTYPTRAWTGPLVVVHGDFRLDNVLFATHDNRLHAKVIDWQTVRLGPPMIDACMFLCSSLSTDVRRRHESELLRGYHDRLCAAGVRDFTFDQCRQSYRQASLWVFLLSFGASVSLAQSERGDAMLTHLISVSADLVEDLDAAEFLA